MTRHLFTTEELQALAHRFRLLRRSAEILALRLDQEERIANAAMHDLALERGVDAQKLMREYRREQLAPERRIFYFNGNEEKPKS